jgi:hypothetical protein
MGDKINIKSKDQSGGITAHTVNNNSFTVTEENNTTENNTTENIPEVNNNKKAVLKFWGIISGIVFFIAAIYSILSYYK